LQESVIATTIAALEIGKFPVIRGNTARGEAFVELVGDQAVDCGLCLGTVIVRNATLALLSMRNIIANGFRNDFWMIVRGAENAGLQTLIDYSVEIGISGATWRFIASCAAESNSFSDGPSLAANRRIAVIELD
jgi:hypothetical protein